MNDTLLHIVQRVAANLSDYRYDRGEIHGVLAVNASNISDLTELAKNDILEDRVVVNGSSRQLDKLRIPAGQSLNTEITLFSQRLSASRYYESLAEFVQFNQSELVHPVYYIRELNYFSGGPATPEPVLAHQKVLELIQLLSHIADYTKQEPAGKTFVLFSRQKIDLPVMYHANHIGQLSDLEDLVKQLTADYDKQERQAVFKNELVTYLLPEKAEGRFSKLLTGFGQIYFNYTQSHLLYLQKFSYNDLKTRVDEDRLNYTRKIYGVVNEIQSKLIAVPAAYLLVFAQFDYSGASFMKNLLIVTGALLFAIILEILLINQFGVLNYLKKEIESFTTGLLLKADQLDVSAFTRDFTGLPPLIRRQQTYLMIFRVVVWLVPLTAFALMFYVKH